MLCESLSLLWRAVDFLVAGPGYYSGQPTRDFYMLETGDGGRQCQLPDFPYDLQEEYAAVVGGKVMADEKTSNL